MKFIGFPNDHKVLTLVLGELDLYHIKLNTPPPFRE